MRIWPAAVFLLLVSCKVDQSGGVVSDFGASGEGCSGNASCMVRVRAPVPPAEPSDAAPAADTARAPDTAPACTRASQCAKGPNSAPVCKAGVCGLTCTAGFTDCDGRGETGCEARLPGDPKNCGACGRDCE